jgi:FAD:protein FMN transferase
MQEFHLETIGTHLRICIDTSSPCGEDFSQIAKRLADFEKKYSRFIENNWLMDLNKKRSGILDEDGKIMISHMLSLSHSSEWYFDPTVGKRLQALGYGMPSDNHKESCMNESYGSYRDIEVQGEIITLNGLIELEFGGIGKGYMLHWIYDFLRMKYDKFLIDFGSDLWAHGTWKVWLENPFALDEVIGTIFLEDWFFACSSWAKRTWGGHHHLIDPHTGESAREVVASYIEASDGMIADGYATTLCVMPWQLACDMLQKTPEIEGVLISKEGDIFQSEGSKSKLFS